MSAVQVGYRPLSRLVAQMCQRVFSSDSGTGVDLARQLRHLEQYGDTPIVLLADENADLDQHHLRRQFSMLVIREPYNIIETAKQIALSCMPP